MPAQPITLLGSELHSLRSQHTGREYRTTVSLPLGYGSPPDERWPFDNMPALWPTVYVLDGNWYHGLVTDIIRPMTWCGSTTDAIVVGIGYLEGENTREAFRTAFTRRNADLTPARDEADEKSFEASQQLATQTGDAANFLKFIQDELTPFIEKTYHSDPANRILVGHSYGGLFGAFAMFEAPGLFSQLILGSPTLIQGERFTFKREEAYAADHQQLPAKVYLFVGDLEEDSKDTTMTDTLRFAAILQGRKYTGFSLVKHVFLDQNHCEVAAAGFQWGLKHALRRSG